MRTKLEHIYWFAPYNLTGSSTRYRGYYPIQLLKDEIECNFVFPTRKIHGILKFIKVYTSALMSRKTNSVIIIQKVCSNRIYAKMLKVLVLLKSENTLYDIDDAEYLRQPTRTLHFFLRKCKIITVGSNALKDYCVAFNNNVIVLTSPVIKHDELKNNRNTITNIGWVGDLGNGNNISKDFSHKSSLFNILFPQIQQLEKPIVLTIIGVKIDRDVKEIRNYFGHNPNIIVDIPRNLDWENDRWVYSEIKKFDIGVSPLTNHPFNVAKSAFKAKQYLSVGVPTVASDVGENKNFVKHNINGFLCQNNEEFKIAIENIISMSNNEYFNLSTNAINSWKDFSTRKYCNSLMEICKNVIKQ